jgi:hypothetical protein
VKRIDGFEECRSLCRIEIPSSLEIIGELGFCECTSLTEIIFSSDSQVKKIYGFRNCTSLGALNFLYRLRSLGRMVSMNAHHWQKSSFQVTVM